MSKSTLIASALLVLASSSALALTPDRDRDYDRDHWKPTSMFMQLGSGDEQTNALSVGANWDWNWRRDYSFGVVTGYTEAVVGRWKTENIAEGRTSAYSTQVGITPVLRLFPTFGSNRWFGEFGIGANYITPVYRAGSKTFSTEFNFGDHVAVGRLLGERAHSSISLRLQHFSNGGIDAPNPGENFIQLRYSFRN